MRKKEQNQRSIMSLVTLLKQVVDDPASFHNDDGFIDALKSQNSLAQFKRTSQGILGCSLNTHKSIAETVLVRGYVELDEHRKNAQIAVANFRERKSGSNKQTKAGLGKKVQELEGDVAILERQNFLLSSLVESLRSKLQHYVIASEKEELVVDFSEFNKELQAKLSYTLYGSLE
ncbi:hypothetical protein ABDK09_07445 [Vibrio sp. CDRSL-10 TSBA]